MAGHLWTGVVPGPWRWTPGGNRRLTGVDPATCHGTGAAHLVLTVHQGCIHRHDLRPTLAGPTRQADPWVDLGLAATMAGHPTECLPPDQSLPASGADRPHDMRRHMRPGRVILLLTSGLPEQDTPAATSSPRPASVAGVTRVTAVPAPAASWKGSWTRKLDAVQRARARASQLATLALQAARRGRPRLAVRALAPAGRPGPVPMTKRKSHPRRSHLQIASAAFASPGRH
mmetsp:Transcript_59807/g.129560  ORF Transcript_59807/g.129560 Transcript_59807/m.129560 type:complete len:230 (-) Transcript_59807:442-1131(-)